MKALLIVALLGLFLGYMMYPVINSSKEQGTVRVEKVKTVTTEVTRTEGLADTVVELKIKNEKLKINPAGSTQFAVNNQEAGISSITIDQAENNGSEINVEYQYPERTITRIDTALKKIIITDNTSFIKEAADESYWQITFGSVQLFVNQVEAKKYFELSYQKKIWGIYLKATAGINNKLNEALNNIKIHTKLELNIPLS